MVIRKLTQKEIESRKWTVMNNGDTVKTIWGNCSCGKPATVIVNGERYCDEDFKQSRGRFGEEYNK